MKLSVIAVDHDGTIARHDVLDPAVRAAIAAARTAGVTVLLVTGRTLEDLQRVAGDLQFVDGVVAENGAVVHFPASGHTSTLAPLLPQQFVAELKRRGIPFGLGRSLVDADVPEAPRHCAPSPTPCCWAPALPRLPPICDRSPRAAGSP